MPDSLRPPRSVRLLVVEVQACELDQLPPMPCAHGHTHARGVSVRVPLHQWRQVRLLTVAPASRRSAGLTAHASLITAPAAAFAAAAVDATTQRTAPAFVAATVADSAGTTQATATLAAALAASALAAATLAAADATGRPLRHVSANTIHSERYDRRL